MKTPTDPTGLMLVGFLLISILMIPAAASQLSSSQEQLNKLINQHQNSPLGILKVSGETINFPWFNQEGSHAYPELPGSALNSAQKEEIIMDNSHPTANVQDLYAMNRQIQRDLIFKDTQRADPDDEVAANHQEISVSGTGNNEYVDDSAENQRQKSGIGGQVPDNNKRDNAGNYLNIDVHDISVSAINTMEGGSAVANSNIIINPVQIIVRSPEVGIKL